MRVGVPRETGEGETRVAIIPETVKRLIGLGKPDGGEAVEVVVEAGAGEHAFVSDDAYRQAGASVDPDPGSVWGGADLVVCVAPPDAGKAGRLKQGGALLGTLRPGSDEGLIRTLVDRRVSAFAFEAVPRISRAQKVDALSSMSTVAGYRAAILAAEACPRFFPMLMTAAGAVTPARVLVLGAGVAGLQAIATARRLGAVVEAYDVRAAAAEQVQSLGARFVELDVQTGDAETAGGYAKEQKEETLRRQRELLAEHFVNVDVVITTALVPGRPAPRLIDVTGVKRLKPGSVIIDLAAEAGGNCELTRPGERVESGGVSVFGPLNLPAQAPVHASQMYSRNAGAFIADMIKDGALALDMEDEVIRGAAITHDGQILHEPTRKAIENGAQA